jgi:hypothetical protein
MKRRAQFILSVTIPFVMLAACGAAPTQEDLDLGRFAISENQSNVAKISVAVSYAYSRNTTYADKATIPIPQTGKVIRDGEKLWCTQKLYEPELRREVTYVSVAADDFFAWAEELIPDMHVFKYSPGTRVPQKVFLEMLRRRPPDPLLECSVPTRLYLQPDPIEVVNVRRDGGQIMLTARYGADEQRTGGRLYEYDIDPTQNYFVVAARTFVNNVLARQTELKFGRVNGVTFPTFLKISQLNPEGKVLLTHLVLLSEVKLGITVDSEQFKLSSLPTYDGKPAIVDTGDQKPELLYFLGGELVDGSTFRSLSSRWVSPNEHRSMVLQKGGQTQGSGMPVSRDNQTSDVVAASGSEAHAVSTQWTVWRLAGYVALGVIIVGALAALARRTAGKEPK